ncbi:MAG TPA: acetyl-CoA decarbonylase/synthase complex subunit alpha/beta [Syntrophorhabdaceae bacterium]|nr:acetyl-CoA decarbonylase/synthase complex subunit alpha/beta [Syntrophorhabdaceae bacterium]HOL05139.1 acetyl-CoA decarbonylase/synthase complex subunit alpha/beta [Syntrophorhabdaceae bacterium]HON84543.1 acetyl-CoA decarbonylase/synthase complex subunit alpha/beta [Syntrophorhabdaceae bacterium]HOT41046.1 acetyl-CoA decarbonylase/synthase complex subunit alpha/beta [Syntrophorhabdaceae bacterium]HPC66251.1 acetyl-CoA decarbonylase/synthase complex subunit alpha/beta [Syntrophorhabdaceae ba
MSKIIASAAIRGAHKILNRARDRYKKALDRFGPEQEIGFPNTAYYLPIIYAITGIGVSRIKDIEAVLKICERLIPPPVKENTPLPYLAPSLDAGMATLFAEEVIEAIRYLEEPDFYLANSEDVEPAGGKIWLGAANDVIFRKRGVEFVDGTAPGFAAIAGAAPDPETASKIALELQEKNLYVFMCGENQGKRFAEQLVEAGVQIGWPTRLVSFGPDISAAVFAIGFACRVAMAFGGIKPGEFRKNLIYNKDRTYAFVLALGDVTDEWYANAAGAINWGFPTIADTPIPQVLPTGICTYEHVVSNIPHEHIVQKAVEVRGLKVQVSKVPIPVSYGPAFEGERVRGEDIYLEMGGGRTIAVEWTTSKRMEEVEDGRIDVVGKDVTDVEPGARLHFAMVAEVAGRNFQEDFEPILERQNHHLINQAQGIMHIGQRDIAWIRISKQAVEKGFRLEHIARIIHAKYHQEFGAIFDKVQIKIYTDEEKVREILDAARASYAYRDARIEGMTDESVDTFYSCILCQSFAPSHVCIVSPERTGLCGAYNWLDCRAAYEINPDGPNQPVKKGECLDDRYGQFKGCNEYISRASRQKIQSVSLYSLMVDPMTTCGCCECIAAILPMCNGIMTVDRDFTEMTPCGMKFTTLAGSVGGGAQTPGFLGHSKYNITQRKFLKGDGGILRLVWMPKRLKEELRDRLQKRGEELGIPNLPDIIADETVALTEEEVLNYITEKGHPCLTLEPLL